MNGPRADCGFDHIVTCSFSNGIASQRKFVSAGVGVEGLPRKSFNLVGQVSGLLRHDSRVVAYDDIHPRTSTNPVVSHGHLCGHFKRIHAANPKGTDHERRQLLLMHRLATRF